MNKQEMIDYMKKEEITFDDFGLGEELNGWVFKIGHFECYLENKSLLIDGYVGSSIYESDLT